MIRRPPRSTLSSSSAASDVYKRQVSDLPPTPNLAALVEELRAQVGGLRSANGRLREVVVGKDELLAGKEGSQTRRAERAPRLGSGGFRQGRPVGVDGAGGVLDVRAAAGRGRTRCGVHPGANV